MLFKHAGFQGAFFSIDDYRIEDMTRGFDGNVAGVFIVLQTVAPVLGSSFRPGSIVNITSMAGVGGAPNMSSFDAISEGARNNCYVLSVFVVVLAAETDGTGRSIAFLIGCLLAIAGIMTALTIWYWRFTSPKRVAERLAAAAGPARDFDLIEPEPPVVAGVAAEAAEPSVLDSEAAEVTDQSALAQPASSLGIAAITDAIRSEEAAKSDSQPFVTAKLEAHSSPFDYESEGSDEGGPSVDKDPDPLVLDSADEFGTSEPGSDSTGRSISDEAWERITQSMLDSYKTHTSET